MERRVFGRTGEMLFSISVGGFHSLEISDHDSLGIMNTFLDGGVPISRRLHSTGRVNPSRFTTGTLCGLR